MANLAQRKDGHSDRVMKTWHIHIEGRVQGVGFRPFIYRLAKSHNLHGEVANTNTGVHISVNTDHINDFIDDIKKLSPSAARILSINYCEENQRDFNSFNIIESKEDEKVNVLLTPDIGLCKNCKRELHSKDDRRHEYAFITCTQCGPRYSVLKGLPYDRHETTMSSFTMCKVCSSEYNNVNNRRFYSQTNSCHSCGIQLEWLKGGTDKKDHITQVHSLLENGKIIAVKGIGGFLLLADATQKKTIETLRIRKNRPNKPFACLFKDLDTIKHYARVSKDEAKLLLSPEAPIVLLRLKNGISGLPMHCIAPGLNKVGIMLPYAPILELISASYNRPLIATSANVSGSPIVYKDSEALRLLDPIADAILTNNRDIVFPQDDSVIEISSRHNKKIILRRSRGYAPSLDIPEGTLQNNALAFGAEMKSAFALTHMGNTYLSQFLGDTSKFESQQSFDHVFKNLYKVLSAKPNIVLVDAHPNYHSSQKGKEWARKRNLELVEIQHHKSHFGAILAEHNLLESDEKIMGVVWDGMGFGEDGNIWGGEFFMFKDKSIKRIGHLDYFPYLANNRMSKEPAVAALAAYWPEQPPKEWLESKFKKDEIQVLTQLLKQPKLFSSSIGRLFDAVAGILDVCSINSFEGEASMRLQALAEKSELKNGEFYTVFNNSQLCAHTLLKSIHEDHREYSSKDIALKFHFTLTKWIKAMAEKYNAKNIAFSGGVFQNSLLVDMIVDEMISSHKLYFHSILSPNDENCAIGQLALMNLKSKEESLHLNKQKPEICV